MLIQLILIIIIVAVSATVSLGAPDCRSTRYARVVLVLSLLGLAVQTIYFLTN